MINDLYKLSKFMNEHHMPYQKTLEKKLKRLGMEVISYNNISYITKETALKILEIYNNHTPIESFIINSVNNFREFHQETLSLVNHCNENDIHVISIDDLPFLHTTYKYFIQNNDFNKLSSLIKTDENHYFNSIGTNELNSSHDDPSLIPSKRIYYKSKFGAYEELLEPIKQLPETYAILYNYVKKHYYGKYSYPAVKSFIELLHKDKELSNYSLSEETELIDNVSLLDKDLATYIFSFLKEYKASQPGNSTVSYIAKRNSNDRMDVTVSLEKYVAMSYMLFNHEHIKKNHMFEKSLDSKFYANQYLYMAMHYNCAWRSFDIITMPIPILFEDKEKIKEDIRNGSFDQVRSDMYISFIETELANLYRKPHKTEKSNNAPTLHLGVIESYRHVLGTIIAICTIHYYESGNTSNQFLNIKGMNALTIAELLGQDYIRLCGRKNFISLAYNKRHLQQLEAIAKADKNDRNGIDAYMLASLARSHVGGYEAFASSTRYYLSAKMDGLTTNEILLHMFERGICSFVPYLLLDGLEKENFQMLDVQQQTNAIKHIPYDVYALEKICENNGLMQQRITQQFKFLSTELLIDQQNYKSKVLELLKNLSTGKASSKEPFCYCLRQAAGYECTNPSRSSCIGCGYEIYLKSFFFHLGIKINQCKVSEENATTKFSKHKYRLYNATVLYPIAQELLLCMKEYYKIDISHYQKILKNTKSGKLEESYYEIFIEENRTKTINSSCPN
ncbi:MAG: hypothetical protein IKU20_02085 [Lachnospiraceae bacterium]|nr:hypothetical protein [Lachnospiraceae bacterium]